MPLIGQLTSLIHSLQDYSKQGQAGQSSPFTAFLNTLGISHGLLVQSTQVLLYTFWKAWQTAHPEQFPQGEGEVKEHHLDAPELGVAET